MPGKTILAYLHSQKNAGHIAEAAARFAASRQAHVIGLHVIANFPPYDEFTLNLSAATLEQFMQPAKQEAEAIQKSFEDAVAAAGVSSEWRCMRVDFAELVDLVTQHARSADMAVIGQQSPLGPLFPDLNLPEEVILDSGRPVLLVPNAPSVTTFGTHVLAAWNNTRESARAIYDSLEVLKAAQSVRLLTVNPRPTLDGWEFASGMELAANLRRQGVNISSEAVEVADVSVGEYILSRIADTNSDLLVMGCFGHPRWRETLLGGVSKEVLRSVTVPALLSH
jgi:nucleotide-binding universal stress UspA family protein